MQLVNGPCVLQAHLFLADNGSLPLFSTNSMLEVWEGVTELSQPYNLVPCVIYIF